MFIDWSLFIWEIPKKNASDRILIPYKTINEMGFMHAEMNNAIKIDMLMILIANVRFF